MVRDASWTKYFFDNQCLDICAAMVKNKERESDWLNDDSLENWTGATLKAAVLKNNEKWVL